MQTPATTAAAVEIIEGTHQAIGGALPIPADQLAAYGCGFVLVPHMHPSTVPAAALATDAADGVTYLHYDATQPPAVQARCIALLCARWLVERAGKSPEANLVQAVATGLCGGCKPLVKASAALLLAVAGTSAGAVDQPGQARL